MQRGPSAKRAQSSHYVFQDVEGKADLSGKGQGPTPTRKRAKRTALTVGLVVVAFLVLGFMMYISQSYLDARSALLEERFLMQQKIKRFQVELETLKHEMNTTNIALMKKDRVIKAQEELIRGSTNKERDVAGDANRNLMKQWKQPAFNAAVAAKARGGDTLIENDPRSEKRRQAVRRAMKHAWSGYRKYAWGSDELEPITKRGVNEFGHTGVTVIDAIDTLWIMDLKEEYNEAREYLKDYPNKLSADTLSVFECTIRVLGGFMSTYYLTGDRLFLENAKLVGDRLLPAFHHSGKKEHPQWKINDIGMPKGHVSLKTMHTHHPQWQHGRVMLSEFGTNLLEFNALSRETGNMKYAEAAAKPLRAIHEKYPKKGLLPSYFLPNGKLSSRQLPSSSTIFSPPSLPLRTDFDSMQV